MQSLDDLEKVARDKYAQGIACTPADSIFFTAEEHAVVEAKTPLIFVGSKLCGCFNIVKYIESGAFGMQEDSKDVSRVQSCSVVFSFPFPLSLSLLSPPPISFLS